MSKSTSLLEVANGCKLVDTAGGVSKTNQRTLV